jgi:hypothetical protein
MLLALLPLPVASQYPLYTCMVTSNDYVVGATLPPTLSRRGNSEIR